MLFLDGHVKAVNQSSWVPVSRSTSQAARVYLQPFHSDPGRHRPGTAAPARQKGGLGVRCAPEADFTFLELIVSMSLIMALVALLFPVFARTPEAARRTSCESNLRQIATACHLYAMDNNGHLPPDPGGASGPLFWSGTSRTPP